MNDVGQALLAMRVCWAPSGPTGQLEPVGLPHRAMGAALHAASVLEQRGWHHRRIVKIRYLQTMLHVEHTIPARN